MSTTDVPQDTAPTPPPMRLRHSVRNLIEALEQINPESKDLSHPSNQAGVRALLRELALPIHPAPTEIERAFRRAEALLWPSVLLRAGYPEEQSDALTHKLALFYQAMSSPNTRAELAQLAATHGQGNEQLAREKLPAINRALEQSLLESPRADDASPESPVKTGAQRASGHHPKRRRLMRTAGISAGFLVGGLATYRAFEIPLATAIIETPRVDALFNRWESELAHLDTLSDGAFRGLERLEEGWSWIGELFLSPSTDNSPERRSNL